MIYFKDAKLKWHGFTFDTINQRNIGLAKKFIWVFL